MVGVGKVVPSPLPAQSTAYQGLRRLLGHKMLREGVLHYDRGRRIVVICDRSHGLGPRLRQHLVHMATDFL